MKRKENAPVLLVNPRKRKKGKRRRATKRRRNPARRTRRRSNPKASSWTDALVAVLVGGGGGLAGYGASLGAAKIPLDEIPRTAIHGGGAAAVSVLLAKYADERAAAAFMGGSAAMLAQSVRGIIAMRKAGGSSESTEASRIRREAARVYRAREAAALRPARQEAAGAESMAPGIFGRSFKEPAEAGRSFYVNGPIRHNGPHSWVYDYQAGGRRMVSAHNR